MPAGDYDPRNSATSDTYKTDTEQAKHYEYTSFELYQQSMGYYPDPSIEASVLNRILKELFYLRNKVAELENEKRLGTFGG